MAQTLEQILADETKRDAENRARAAALVAIEYPTEAERGELETLLYSMKLVEEQGLADVARCEYLAQCSHDEYVRESKGSDKDLAKIVDELQRAEIERGDQEARDLAIQIITEILEERDQARKKMTTTHRRAQVAEAALGSKRELHAVMMQNHGLRWDNERLRRYNRYLEQQNHDLRKRLGAMP